MAAATSANFFAIIAQIEHYTDRVWQGRGELLRALDCDVGQDNMGPARAHQLGRRKADAPGPAGDHRHLALHADRIGHGLLPCD